MSTQFANTLNNHPIYADRAEKDAAGNTIATTYQEKLTAGTGITIDSSNVISATGGGSTYTAGNGIDISSDVISVQVASPNAGDIVTLDCEGHLVDSGVAPSDLQPKLTAGDGIAIDSNSEISADVDGSTIGIDSTTKKIKLLSTIPTVDQTYSAVSTNAQSGVAVAEAIAAIPAPSVDEVPDVTSSDDGKVLTASYSGGQGSYSWETAQGGGTSYTAGTGIDISAQDAISVKIDGSTITTNASGQLVANGGGGGTSYTAGGGISISSDVISAKVDGTTIGIDSLTKEIKLLSSIPRVPSAGNMLSVTNNTLNVTTTAGITDIRVVNSLPANPVSTVMYCIPVT